MNKTELKKAVKAAGGRKALADALGVSVSSVIKWERGERIPRPEKVLRIEQVSGVSHARLMPTIFA